MIIEQEPIGLSKDYYKKYAKYANSTRALASPIDGMKTVYRRVFWTVNDLPKGKMTKSQSIAGAVMNLHPHGEQSGVLYSAVNAEMKLFDKQGNFGSKILAGSAPRYTECRLNDLGRLYLGGDLINYCEMVEGDLGLMEPKYLSALIPYILTEGNSSMGIGVSSAIPKLNAIDLIDYYIAGLDGSNDDPIVRYNNGHVTFIEDSETLSKDIKSGFMKSVQSHATIEVKGNELIIRDLPDGVSITTFLKKFDSLVEQDLLDIRDESKENLRLVFEIVDTKKLPIKELHDLIIKYSKKKSSYAFTFEWQDKIYYMNLPQIREASLEYLKSCVVRKYEYQLSKSTRDRKVYEVIDYLKTSGIINELPKLTKSDLYKKLSQFEESSIDEALGKSISRLMKVDAEQEFLNIEAKIKEATEFLANPNPYLIELYHKFRSELIKVYSINTQYQTLEGDGPSEDTHVGDMVGVTDDGYVGIVNPADGYKYVHTIPFKEEYQYLLLIGDDKLQCMGIDNNKLGRYIVKIPEGTKLTLVGGPEGKIVGTNGESFDFSYFVCKRVSTPWDLKKRLVNIKEVR